MKQKKIFAYNRLVDNLVNKKNLGNMINIENEIRNSKEK